MSGFNLAHIHSGVNLRMPDIELPNPAEAHFNELKTLHHYAEQTKKPDHKIALTLHTPSGQMHVKRIAVGTTRALRIETYDATSHSIMLVPIEQCFIGIHIFKEDNFEKPFMGFVVQQSK